MHEMVRDALAAAYRHQVQDRTSLRLREATPLVPPAAQ
jgi:hypothetical protein